MTDQRCHYCGSLEVHCWQGAVAWCGSPQCDKRHNDATYEPCFDLPPSRTPIEQGIAACVAWAILLLVRIVPTRWILNRTGWRHRFAVWIYSESYYWEERAEGRV